MFCARFDFTLGDHVSKSKQRKLCALAPLSSTSMIKETSPK